jgi:hypothetical protein
MFVAGEPGWRPSGRQWCPSREFDGAMGPLKDLGQLGIVRMVDQEFADVDQRDEAVSGAIPS